MHPNVSHFLHYCGGRNKINKSESKIYFIIQNVSFHFILHSEDSFADR